MSNIDFKEMKKWMENQTEEDWERMREEHEKKLQRWDELAKTHKPIILSDDRRIIKFSNDKVRQMEEKTNGNYVYDDRASR